MNYLFTQSPRLHYLDWLRVLAFSILLFEHCAELFVPWEFWVKNAETSTLMGYFISLFKPWRMPLLFLVSGAAVYLSCKRKTSREILLERCKRILLPLVAAMLLVIPPQIYFIKLQTGYSESFLQFYLSVFEFKWFPQGSLHWLHLWYLAFIFGFTLLAIPFLPKLRRRKADSLLNAIDKRLHNPLNIIFFGALMSIPYLILNAFKIQGNLAQLVFYFPYFLFGLLLLLRPGVQRVLKRETETFLVLSGITTTLLIIFTFILPEGEILLKQAINSPNSPLAISVVQSLNTWFYVLTIVGYAMRFLNFKTEGLTYANEAVYPFYILHQTVIVALGYYIIQLDASISAKLLLISVLTFSLIGLVYELVIRRNSLTRLLFGLKTGKSKEKPVVVELINEIEPLDDVQQSVEIQPVAASEKIVH